MIAKLLAAWRVAGLPVIHVHHDSTEPDSPYRPGHAGNDPKAVAAPLPRDVVVRKTTNAAFVGTDLEARLRELDAAPVYCGVLTHNSLEATVRLSGNLGFASTVVADACWSVDVIDRRGRLWPAEDVHQLSLTHLDGEYAAVRSSSQVLADLGRDADR